MLIGGVDEVGRGSLAGPLMAVAAIFEVDKDLSCPIEGVRDSKKLTPRKRSQAFRNILKSAALIDFGIGETSVDEINKYGMTWANQKAFDRAVKDTRANCKWFLVDGVLEIPSVGKECQLAIIGGDDKYWPIGAASILAKVIRDSYMAELGEDFKQYNWSKNCGYGSKEHREALKKYGPCILHRNDFVEKLI